MLDAGLLLKNLRMIIFLMHLKAKLSEQLFGPQQYMDIFPTRNSEIQDSMYIPKNIPEDKMIFLMGHGKTVGVKKIDEPIIDGGDLVTVPIADIKEMEDLVSKQDEKITELRKSLAQFIDENTRLNSEIKLLSVKNEAIRKKIYRFEIDKFKKNL